MNRLVPLILAVALFMEQMDSTVISTSLPAIAADLGVGPITLKLALMAYMVSLATFIPLRGWMADRFGAKRIFRLAILVFVAGSILCAVADSLVAFVVSRFLQGMGGAMMTPVARLVLVRSTSRSDLVSAMALLTIPALVGPLAGPPLGGFITTYFSWHWIFLVNVPVGIVGYILSGIYLPEIRAAAPPPLDWMGFLLSAVAASGTMFGLSVVSLPALPPVIGIVATAVGLLCGVLYVRHARRHPAPLLDLKLFRDSAFRAAAIGGTLFRISVGAVPFLMPLMLQVGFGLSPFQSGLVTFTGAVGAIATKVLAKRVLVFAGFRTTLLVASVCGAALTFVNGLFTPATPFWFMAGVLLVAGFAHQRQRALLRRHCRCRRQQGDLDERGAPADQPGARRRGCGLHPRNRERADRHRTGTEGLPDRLHGDLGPDADRHLPLHRHGQERRRLRLRSPHGNAGGGDGSGEVTPPLHATHGQRRTGANPKRAANPRPVRTRLIPLKSLVLRPAFPAKPPPHGLPATGSHPSPPFPRIANELDTSRRLPRGGVD